MVADEVRLEIRSVEYFACKMPETYSKHSPRMLPSLPILHKDPITQTHNHIIPPRRAEIIITKLVCKDSLDIFWITRKVDFLSQEVKFESRAFTAMDLAHFDLSRGHQVGKFLVFVCLLHYADLFEAEEALAWVLGWFLTAEFFCAGCDLS